MADGAAIQDALRERRPSPLELLRIIVAFTRERWTELLCISAITMTPALTLGPVHHWLVRRLFDERSRALTLVQVSLFSAEALAKALAVFGEMAIALVIVAWLQDRRRPFGSTIRAAFRLRWRLAALLLIVVIPDAGIHGAFAFIQGWIISHSGLADRLPWHGDSIRQLHAMRVAGRYVHGLLELFWIFAPFILVLEDQSPLQSAWTGLRRVWPNWLWLGLVTLIVITLPLDLLSWLLGRVPPSALREPLVIAAWSLVDPVRSAANAFLAVHLMLRAGAPLMADYPFPHQPFTRSITSGRFSTGSG